MSTVKTKKICVNVSASDLKSLQKILKVQGIFISEWVRKVMKLEIDTATPSPALKVVKDVKIVKPVAKLKTISATKAKLPVKRAKTITPVARKLKSKTN